MQWSMHTDIDFLIEATLDAPWPQPVDLACLRREAGEVVARLVDRLEHEPGALRRRRICDLLVDVAVDPGRLAPYLTTSSWYVARNLAYVLGELRDPNGIALLGTLGRHEEYRVRREVIDALRKIPGERSRAALRSFVHDPDPRIRRHLIDGMGSGYDPQLASWLLGIVRSRDYSRAGASLKEAAIAALARMGASEAQPVLERVARRRWVFGRMRRLQDAARGALAQAYSSSR